MSKWEIISGWKTSGRIWQGIGFPAFALTIFAPLLAIECAKKPKSGASNFLLYGIILTPYFYCLFRPLERAKIYMDAFVDLESRKPDTDFYIRNSQWVTEYYRNNAYYSFVF